MRVWPVLPGTHLEPRSIPRRGALYVKHAQGPIMIQTRFQLPALIVALSLGACGGARDVDYSRSRSISADTAATHEAGATSVRAARTTPGEPVGSIPWQMRD